MDISVTTDEYVAEDRSWLGSRDGTDVTQGITLDPALFTEATHFPDGYIASGTVLGRVTATGFYGPYNNGLTNGLETAVGFLFNSTKVRTGGPKVGAPLHWRGVIREAKLPANHGLDSAAKTDLAAKFRFQ
ncbi:head decoration protein [Micromonospora sp. C51]|uniref:head decoration protein n=1 Tax=Micromonospora sp. C51 TaxID=2824879 RepID=UPI001B358F72|nr:head decoration protein [Micromonospora sp. C51]MBQ1047862.1 head decoration protein [Micromonospora sp. C51]